MVKISKKRNNEEEKVYRSEGDISTSWRRKEFQNKLPENVKDLLNQDADYFIHQSLSTPCLNVVKKAYGAYIETMDGKKILDFHGNSVHHVGYSNPEVIKAVTEQLQELPFSVRRYTNEKVIKLAKKLSDITPRRLNRVLFCPGGTDAVEIALKLAMGYTNRYKTLSFWDAFHGASFGSISVGGEALFRADLPLLPGGSHVFPPDCYRCPYGFACREDCNLDCALIVRETLEKENDIAAFVGETIRSMPYVPPDGFWKIVREACDDFGAVLIIDLIPQCLGKTGRMFPTEHYDLEPDIMVLGKGLGGGVFPFAGVIADNKFNALKNRAVGHYTHEKSPVGAAAALATIKYIEENNLVGNAAKIGEYCIKRLEEMKESYEIIGDVRGKGLMLGIELVKDRKTKERAIDETEAIQYRCLGNGLSFKTTMGNIISLYPPLIINKEQMDNALNIIENAIKEVI